MINIFNLFIKLFLASAFQAFALATIYQGYTVEFTNQMEQKPTNVFLDIQNNVQTTCAVNCSECESSQICTQCQEGYFLYSLSPVHPQTFCVKCPEYSYDSSQPDLKRVCEDCKQNPTTWYLFISKNCGKQRQVNKLCTVDIEIQKDTNSNIISAVQKPIHVLFEVVQDPQNQNQFTTQECVGCGQWCTETFMNTSINCNSRPASSISKDVNQQQFYCQQGYSYLQSSSKCIKCPDNCLECYAESQQCTQCAIGYAIDKQRKCTKCSDVINNCQECYYGEGQMNLNLYPYYWDQYPNAIMRCQTCKNQLGNSYIPNFDLTTCDKCDSTCQTCKYIEEVDNKTSQINHTAAPYIATSANNFHMVCSSCNTNTQFVTYDGKCSECDIANCDLCYYGTNTPTTVYNWYYTLQFNFMYVFTPSSDPDYAFEKKCFSCNSNTLSVASDGKSCENYTASVGMENCSKTRKYMIGTDAKYECLECFKGYGFNIRKNDKTRVCEKIDNSDTNCISSFFESTPDGNEITTCQKCADYYTPTVANGCVRCQTGLKPQYEDDNTGGCKKCSFISQQGKDFSFFLYNFPRQTKSVLLAIEQKENIPQLPYCYSCHNSNDCKGSCNTQCDSCQNINDFSFFGSNNQCNHCKNLLISTPSSLPTRQYTQSVSTEFQDCVQCPRYCARCETRSEEEIKSINPYFQLDLDNRLEPFLSRCLECLPLEKQCYSSQSDVTNNHPTFTCDKDVSGNMVYGDKEFTVKKDTNIEQCLPCPNSNPFCRNSIKFIRIVDCQNSPNVNSFDKKERDYFINNLQGDINQSSFQDGIDQDVIFLTSLSIDQSIFIDFATLEDISQKQVKELMYYLNEEVYSNIEFDIIFIPEIISNLQFESTQFTNVNSCTFSNDVFFQTNMAKYVFNINQISLNFKVFNKGTKTIEQSNLFLFVSKPIYFSGWNTYNFNSLTIVPLSSYSKRYEKQPFGLDFSKNLFLSSVNFEKVSILSFKEEGDASGYPATIYPIINLERVNSLSLKSFELSGFKFPTGQSLFKFNILSSSSMKIEGKDIKYSYLAFNEVILFPFYSKNMRINIQGSTFNAIKFEKSKIFSDELAVLNTDVFGLKPIYILQLSSFKFTYQQFIDSMIVDCRIMRNVRLNQIQLEDLTTAVSNISGKMLSIFSSTTFEVEDFSFKQIYQLESMFNQLNIFSFPTQTDSYWTQQPVTFKKIVFENIKFTNGMYQLFNLKRFTQANTNGYYVIKVEISDIHLTNIKVEKSTAPLLYFNNLEQVQITGLYILDQGQRVNNVLFNNIEAVLINDGYCKRSQRPNFDPNQPIINQIKQSTDDQLIKDDGFCLQFQEVQLIISIEKFQIQHQFIQNYSPIEIRNSSPRNQIIYTQIVGLDIFAKIQPYIEQVDQANSKNYIYISDCSFQDNGYYNQDVNSQVTSVFVKSISQVVFVMKKVSFEQIEQNSFQMSVQLPQSNMVLFDSIQSTAIFETVTSTDTSSYQGQNGLWIVAKYLEISNNSSFQKGNMNSIQDEWSVDEGSASKVRVDWAGGFVYAKVQSVLIDSTKFSETLASVGGAVYIEGFGLFNAAFNKVTFQNVFTSKKVESQGLGGAVYINVQTFSPKIFFYDITCKNIFSKSQGGFAYIQLAEKDGQIIFSGGDYANVFAPQGSLIKVNLIGKKDLLRIKDIQFYNFDDGAYNNPEYILSKFQKEGDEMEFLPAFLLSFQQFVMIWMSNGQLDFSGNTFRDLTNFQGLLYTSTTTVTMNQNTIKNSQFYYTPYINLANLSTIDMNTNTFSVLSFCSDCYKKTNFQELFISQNYKTQSSFIAIRNPTKEIPVIDTTFDQIICPTCTESIFTITEITSTVTFSGLQITNSEAGNGMLSIVNAAPAQAFFRNLLSTPQVIINSSQKQNSLFKNNKAYLNGGAIYATYVALTLQQGTEIMKNKSLLQGGGIYFVQVQSNTQNLILNQATITENIAAIAGGIRLIGGEYKSDQSVIQNNKATQYGGNFLSYPSKLKISVMINKTLKEITKKNSHKEFIISDYAPGQSTNNQIVVQLLDTEGNIVGLENGSNEKATIEFTQQQGQSFHIVGQSTAIYDSKNMYFIFDTMIIQTTQQAILNAIIYTPIAKTPLFKSNGDFDKYIRYDLPIEIQTRKCNIGEAFIQAQGTCLWCEKGTYSLKENSLECQSCPAEFANDCPEGNQIVLKPGYWRPTLISDLIERCSNNQQNCLGGEKVGDSSCAEGHIGALCESCDIYGTQWGESYSNSDKFECGKCKEIKGNNAKMAVISLYTMAAIIFSVISTKNLIDSEIQKYYLLKLGFISGRSASNSSNIGILIKIFTTYIQLLCTISSFDLKLPPGIDGFTSNIGDPVQQMSFSMDCGLVEIADNIPIIYFRMIWSLIMPFIYASVFLSIYFLFILISYVQQNQTVKKKVFQSTYIWICFIYIYISMQPSIVTQFIQSISCRQISGENYIKANVAYVCYTDQHIKYSVGFIIPVLLLFVFFIPAFFFTKLYLNKNKVNSNQILFVLFKLEQMSIKYKFGFLYSEYKQNAYFWEIIKICQKTFVIIFLNIYENSINIKGVLMVLVVFSYYQLQLKYKPYTDNKYNKLDQLTNIAIIITIILAVFVYQNKYPYLIWMAYIVMFAINIFALLQIIYILFGGYAAVLENKMETLFRKFATQFPRLAKLLKISKVEKVRIRHLWKCARYRIKFFVQSLKQAKDAKYLKSVDQFIQIVNPDRLPLGSSFEIDRSQQEVKKDKQGTKEVALRTHDKQLSQILVQKDDYGFQNKNDQSQRSRNSDEKTNEKQYQDNFITPTSIIHEGRAIHIRSKSASKEFQDIEIVNLKEDKNNKN